MNDADQTVKSKTSDHVTELAGSGPFDGDEPAYRWLAVAWPLALLFHLLGNGAYIDVLLDGVPTMVALLQLMVALLAVLVILRPRPPYVLVLSFLYLLVTWYKAPFIGNHEIILALSAVVVTGSVITSDRAWPSTALPILRWVLITAYAAIAFSKLNGSFLDPSVSCAVVFGDELSGWLGFHVSDHEILSFAAIGATAVVEMAIPVLLVVRRLRLAGVALAMVFHFVLALEPVGHVFDFTATLFPLFFAFTPTQVQDRVSNRIDGLAPRGGRPILALGALIVVVAHLMVLRFDAPAWAVAYPAWLLVGTTVLWWSLSSLLDRVRATGSLHGDRVAARGPLVLLVPVVGLLLVNAASPYLQLRTAAAFNMYSNLETVRADGDHLLFGGVDPIRAPELVVIIDAPEDHPLQYYVAEDRALPLDNLRWFQRQRILAATTSDELRNDDEVSLRMASAAAGDPPQRLSDLDVDGGGLTDTLAHKLGFVRAVDLSTPARCLRTWGPAG